MTEQKKKKSNGLHPTPQLVFCIGPHNTKDERSVLTFSN